jgi:hypothetical protein
VHLGETEEGNTRKALQHENRAKACREMAEQLNPAGQGR